MTTEERLVQYQVVAARRTTYDTMVWQVPGLALTAQAFLMTIGLAPGTGRLARVAVGLLSVVVALMAAQLLLRHRQNELADAKWLESFERASGWETVHMPATARAAQVGLVPSGLARLRSYRVWIGGLSTFGLIGLAIALWAVIR
ncbi:hypothetical protein GCM10010193_32550 [Kitasatospora atroaurantiaca]|uniref:Uncharacterized protein n=1 Tax=Kitasatospora atroaurantiaca TaxID=285545 RepID=A0A561ERK3_9ACTN|nr:hypothetical protein [Kitasatospora atroaurantiaca]TWE18236.1 hypothetical protein FB465_3289 [Kitasatospora atroaurantiaca]